MSWPLSHEFNEAIQSPKVAFADPDLRDGEVVVGATGLPLPRSGNFADVYQMRGADGRDWAVKCFTRPVAGLGERYAKVSAALEKANLPFAVGFKFLAEGIRVGGVWRPIVKMEWVEGLLLNQVVRESAGKPPKLVALTQMWAKLCKRLREAGIAHADLQHGNVLLVPGTRAGAYGLKLIDYDGVWVPALANTPSGESGHPSFQHPARAATRAYSPDVDRFPHLVVATALRGLSVAGAPLWEKYDNGDNLLFTEDDYKKPAASKAMLELWHLEDPGVQALVGRLAIACGKPIPQTPWLDQFAPDGEPALLDEATRREAAAALGIALPVPVALPPEPTGPVPAPPPPENPFAAVNADEEPPAEVDVELIEEPARKSKKPKESATTKSKRHKAYQPEKASNKGLILAGAGAGLLVLVGVVAAVVLTGGKPKETAQQKEDPPPVVTPKPGPNDPVVVPPKKDNNPVLGPPKKEPDNTPPTAPAKWAIKSGWVRGLPDDWKRAHGLRVAPDSRTAQVYAGDGLFYVFDTESGAPLKNPPDAAGILYGVHVLDGGRVVKTWQVPGGPLQIWDARAGKEAAALARVIDGAVHVEVSPNGRYMAAWLGHGQGKVPLKLADTSTGKTLVDLAWTRGSVTFTADSSRALVADGHGQCRWVKLPSGEAEGEWSVGDGVGHVGVVSVSGDGSRVVVTGSRLGVQLLDGATGRAIRPIKGDVAKSALSADGKVLLVSRYDGARRVAELTDADTGDVLLPIPQADGIDPTALGLAPDGGAVFVARPAGADRFELAGFNLSRGGAVAPPVSPSDPGPSVATVKERFKTQLDTFTRETQFGGDGRAILTYEWNKRELTIVDARTGAAQVTNAPNALHPRNVIPLPGGRAGLIPTGSKEIAVVSTETGKVLGTIPLPTFPAGSNPFYGAVAVSPDDRYVAVGLDSTTKQDPDTKKPVTTPGPFQVLDTKTNKVIVAGEWTRTHQGGQIVFSPDSSRVLVVDATLRGRWYKLPSGEPDKAWTHAADQTERVHIRDVSRDGRLMLCEGTVEGWHRAYVVDTATGERVATLVKVIGVMTGVGLSADGRRALLSHLKAGGKESDFVIADTATGAEVARVPRPVGPESDAVGALSPDGRALVVTDRRKSAPLVVYDIPAGPGGGGGPVAVAGPLPPPAAPLEMKQKWSVDAKIKSGSHPALTGDGSRVAVADRGALPWRIATFDARTGATGPELDKLGGNSAHALFTQDGPAVAYQHDHGRAIVVWDTNTEKGISHAYPQPEGAPRSTPLVAVSPNGKYMTVAHNDGPDQRKEREPTPLLVIDTATGRTVFKTDWKQGRTLFTADGTRLLVVDADDRFRWFHLPDGKPDGEWAFNRPAFGFNAQVFVMSADGRVIAYQGQPPGKEDALHLLDGTNGKVLHSFPAKRYHQAVSVSENGRFVALVRNDGFGPGHTLEVLDAKGHLFTALKFARNSNTGVAVSWKTRTVALFDRTAGTLAAYELPFDPNGSGSAVAAAPAVGDDAVEAPLAGEPPALKARWGNVKVGDGKAFDQLLFAPDAGAVLLGSAAGGFEALDPKSGAPRTVGFSVLNTAGVADFFPLGGTHLGTFSPKATEVKVWDGKTGRLVTKHAVPEVAPGAGGATALRALLAPNEKHLVAARTGPPAPTYPDVPFKVFDATGKKEELATEWKGGEVHFTADSTKVLVAEWGGRCRWFKLPSGDAAESWDLGPARGGRLHRVTSASADGAVLGYTGPAAEKARGNGSGVLDGKTGKIVRVFHSDYFSHSPVEVSADGKRAALIRDLERFALTLDVVDLTSGARVGRARIQLPFAPDGQPSGAAPLFALAPDGRALLIYEPARQRVHLFDVPATAPNAP